jgi:ABC-type Fe3+/spermidine/putrescine transport system ATPase subunit
VSARQASIEVRDLVVRYGEVTAVRGVGFDVGAGEHLTLLGPSGCGKTTTLRAIAGLERPQSGEIRIGGRPVFSSSGRVNIPAERRGLSMVFQSYAIWPHMSVFDNVAYGLRVRKRPAAEVTARVREALDLVQLGDLGARSAARLSGGQQQRVALARAFVFSPAVLLFDEPLSNLDAKLRAEMRVELKELQRRLDITSVYVTHDLEEALAISDRVVVMRDGAIEQVGTPGEIYDRPRNTFVADFVGSANLIRGRRRTDLERDGLIVLETAGGALVHGIAADRHGGAEALMAIRTVRLRLERTRPEAPVNAWPARIRQRVFQGDFTQYHVEWDGRLLIVRSAATEPMVERVPCHFSSRATAEEMVSTCCGIGCEMSFRICNVLMPASTPTTRTTAITAMTILSFIFQCAGTLRVPAVSFRFFGAAPARNKSTMRSAFFRLSRDPGMIKCDIKWAFACP